MHVIKCCTVSIVFLYTMLTITSGELFWSDGMKYRSTGVACAPPRTYRGARSDCPDPLPDVRAG